MKYMGEYTLKVENGQVMFPWDSLVETNRVWGVSEIVVDEEIVIIRFISWLDRRQFRLSY